MDAVWWKVKASFLTMHNEYVIYDRAFAQEIYFSKIVYLQNVSRKYVQRLTRLSALCYICIYFKKNQIITKSFHVRPRLWINNNNPSNNIKNLAKFFFCLITVNSDNLFNGKW